MSSSIAFNNWGTKGVPRDSEWDLYQKVASISSY